MPMTGIRLQGHESGGDPDRRPPRAPISPRPAAWSTPRWSIATRSPTGHRIAGPALVEERESTIVVLPGDIVSVSPAGNLIIDIKAGA